MTAAVLTAALLVAPVTDAFTYRSRCLDLPVCEIIETSPAPTDLGAPPATAAPTTRTPPPPPLPATRSPDAGGSSVERWRDLVAAYFPADQVDKALAVMACESGGDPSAYNPSGAAGLMQVHWPSWGDHYGVSVEDLFDPATNLAIAADIWANGGWSHWSCA